MSKTIALTFLLFLGFSFSNCNGDDDLCGDLQFLPFFDIQSMDDLRHFSLTKNQSNIFLTEDEVKLEDYAGVKIAFDVNYISQQTSSFPFSFSLMNSALACSPVPNGTSGSKTEKFQSISIITLQDFDDEHPANSSINDLINISPMDFDGTILPEEDLTEFLAKDELIEASYYFLKPKSTPVSSADFQVKVTITLNSGETFEGSSEMIQLIE